MRKANPLFVDSTKMRGDSILTSIELRGLKNHFGASVFVRIRDEAVDAEKVFHVDVRNFDFDALKSIDVVAGGPPCQPFSMGGKHLANDDSRDMFPYAIKAIERLAPKAFIFDNVELSPRFAVGPGVTDIPDEGIGDMDVGILGEQENGGVHVENPAVAPDSKATCDCEVFKTTGVSH